MKTQSIKGTNDIISPEVNKWLIIESLARNIFKLHGYEEVRTPIIELTELFKRSIGEGTDIVQKEMFTFCDRGKRSITLRPEETASIARAYLENKLDKQSGLSKLYYIGAMFRSERPQAGRLRQFHQIGVEAIGSYDPYLDVEVIALMHRFANELGLKEHKIIINNLGCLKDRNNYKKVLKDALKKHLASLCPNCKKRYEINPLRVLDCKDEGCHKIINKLPSLPDCICQECQKHFDNVKDALKDIKIPFSLNPRLVRGLDYYNKTAFELIHNKLGAQNAICAGGRYDNLIKEFGGQETGACGFAFGIERLLMACEAEGIKFKSSENSSVYIAALDSESLRRAFRLINLMRDNRIKAIIDYQNKSLKAQMRQANKLQTKFVIIIGEEELKKDIFILKDMDEHRQSEVKEEELLSILKKKLT